MKPSELQEANRQLKTVENFIFHARRKVDPETEEKVKMMETAGSTKKEINEVVSKARLKGGVTIVVLKGKEIHSVGICRCDPRDGYSRPFGTAVGYLRAMTSKTEAGKQRLLHKLEKNSGYQLYFEYKRVNIKEDPNLDKENFKEEVKQIIKLSVDAARLKFPLDIPEKFLLN